LKIMERLLLTIYAIVHKRYGLGDRHIYDTLCGVLTPAPFLSGISKQLWLSTIAQVGQEKNLTEKVRSSSRFSL
jgi:hypothetical protein